MEKIYKCYGRRFKLAFVPKQTNKLCPGCVFDGKERFCVMTKNKLRDVEKAMADNCCLGSPNTTAVYKDVTPWYLRLWNWLIRRK